jgi:hypothetical protein
MLQLLSQPIALVILASLIMGFALGYAARGGYITSSSRTGASRPKLLLITHCRNRSPINTPDRILERPPRGPQVRRAQLLAERDADMVELARALAGNRLSLRKISAALCHRQFMDLFRIDPAE